MDMKNCRGSIKLKTACGKCPRCLESLAANIHCVSPSGSHPKPLMKKYTIETGKFGQYFRDNEAKRDIPLEEVAALLNGEATEQAEESGYSKARRHEEDNLQWQRDNRA